MWKLQSDQRLDKWKKFRKELSGLPLTNALEQTADFWNSCPWVPFYLDDRKPEEWPDPWTLIAENYYCELAKCLGMLYTMYLTEHVIEPIISCYIDQETRGELYILEINEKYILNMTDGEVVNRQDIPTKYKLKFMLDADQLGIHQYR